MASVQGARTVVGLPSAALLRAVAHAWDVQLLQALPDPLPRCGVRHRRAVAVGGERIVETAIPWTVTTGGAARGPSRIRLRIRPCGVAVNRTRYSSGGSGGRPGQEPDVGASDSQHSHQLPQGRLSPADPRDLRLAHPRKQVRIRRPELTA